MHPHQLYEKLAKIILSHKKILCTTHVHPDADGIGSCAALHMALSLKKISCDLLLESDLHPRYQHLLKGVPYKSLSDYPLTEEEIKQNILQYDLVIVVDTNKISRVGARLSIGLTEHSKVIYVDHHPCKNLTEFHYIDQEAAATAEMVGSLLQLMNITFSRAMADALYSAILIDTNVFRYPSVRPNTHKLIAEFLETGIVVTAAYNAFNGTKKLHHVHLLGHILKSCQLNDQQNVAWIWIRESDLMEYQTDLEETHAFINNLLALEGVKVACMFRQDGTRVKISLRSRGEVDVGLLASLWGGGGHSHSAAAVLEYPLEDSEIFEKKMLLSIERFLQTQNDG